MRLCIIALVLLLALARCNSTAFAEDSSDIEILGTDRSRIELVPPDKILEFPLEKEMLFERGDSYNVSLLGPVTLWGRMLGGENSSFSSDLLSGIALEHFIADLHGSYNAFDGRREGERSDLYDVSLALSRISSSLVTIRATSHLLKQNRDLMGTLGNTSLSNRTDEAETFNVDFDFGAGKAKQLTVGAYYRNFVVDRNDRKSERDVGLKAALYSDRYSVNLKWVASSISGDDEAYAVFEMRDDYLVRSGDLTAGGIFGIHLIAGNQVILAPKLTAVWSISPMMKLHALAGISCELPSLERDILGRPEIDPYDVSQEATRSFVTQFTLEFAPASFSNYKVQIEYRNDRFPVYLEALSDGYLGIARMGDADFVALRGYWDLRLSQYIKLFGEVAFTYAYPGGDFDRYPYLPLSQTKMGVKFDISGGFSVTIDVEFRGSVYADPDGSVKLPSYHLFGFESSYTIADNVLIVARGTNIFNAEHYLYDGWLGYPRMIMLGVEIRF